MRACRWTERARWCGNGSRFVAVGALLLALVVSAFDPAIVLAQTFTIANGDTTGLINAITTANGNGQDNVINLASGGTYAFAMANNTGTDGIANGLPVVVSGGRTLTINGNGATFTRTTTNSLRFLSTSGASVVVINNLTLTNGLAQALPGQTGSMGGTGFPGGSGTDGYNATGGAILNAGTLTLVGCTLSGNVARAGAGGRGGSGGNGHDGNGNYGGSGSGGGGRSGYAFGGAIAMSNPGGGLPALTIDTTTFTGNAAMGGAGGAGGAAGGGGSGGTGTNGGGGGDAKKAGDGGRGYPPAEDGNLFPVSAEGGAIKADGAVTVTRSTFASNSALGGAGGPTGRSGQPGSGGTATGGGSAGPNPTGGGPATSLTVRRRPPTRGAARAVRSTPGAIPTR